MTFLLFLKDVSFKMCNINCKFSITGLFRPIDSEVDFSLKLTM